MALQYCNQCGRPVSATARFCSHCGVAIVGNPAPNAPSAIGNQPRRRGKSRIFQWAGIGCGGLLLIFALLVVIGAVVSSSGEESTSRTANNLPTPTPTFEGALSQASTVTYDELFRNNEQHIGAIVNFRGEVVQVVEGWGDDSYDLRVNVTESEYFWEDTVYLNYSGQRLLEGDIIEFVGKVKGLKRYSAIFGNSVTIPEIDVVQSRLVSKASQR